MAEEIQEAVQIIRVAYEGIEIAMKVGNGGISAMQKAIDVLKGMLDYEKSLGKTSMKKLLMKGGDLQVYQFNTEDMRKVEKTAKKYGILYSVLPDINKKEGLSEIIFHSEATPRVKMMSQKVSFGRITSFDDYLKNGNENDLNNLMEFLKGQNLRNDKIHTEEAVRAGILMEGLIEKVGLFAMEKQTISVDSVKDNFSIDKNQAENIISQLEKIGVLDKIENGEHKVIMNQEAFQNRLKGYQELADRMKAISATKDTSLSDITISKKLIVTENNHAVKTRVPGAWGKFMWINKDNIMEIHNGKTMLTFLDRNKEYKIYDDENRVLETINGETLYSRNYDKVEAVVRERYEKAQNQAKASRPVRKNTVKR